MRHSILAAVVIAPLLPGAALAASGDLIKNGTGTITVNGVIAESTCEVSVSKTSLDFSLSLAELQVTSPQKLTTLPVPVTFQGCGNNTGLIMTLNSTHGEIGGGGYAKFKNTSTNNTNTDYIFLSLQITASELQNIDIYDPKGRLYPVPSTWGIHINGDQFYVHVKNNQSASFNFDFNIIARGTTQNATYVPPASVNAGIIYAFKYL